MRDEKNERFPSYVPTYYRAYVKIRKVYRQAKVRCAEAAAKKGKAIGVTPDGDASWANLDEGQTTNPVGVINKSAVWIDEDMMVPEVKLLADKFDGLKKLLTQNGLKFTNTAGTFLSRMFYPRSEKTKLWENVWTIHHSNVQPGDRVLDIGGASTAFSFFLAQMGCSVAIVDNDWGNCGTLFNSDYVAKKMKWDLISYDHDISKPLPFPDSYFDKIFSICTVEHLTSDVRQIMMREVGRVLKPNGITAITMGYDNNMEGLLVDKGLRFGYRNKLKTDIIEPSGLKVYGNAKLKDLFPNEDFLGALFLVKE